MPSIDVDELALLTVTGYGPRLPFVTNRWRCKACGEWHRETEQAACPKCAACRTCNGKKSIQWFETGKVSACPKCNGGVRTPDPKRRALIRDLPRMAYKSVWFEGFEVGDPALPEGFTWPICEKCHEPVDKVFFSERLILRKKKVRVLHHGKRREIDIPT